MYSAFAKDGYTEYYAICCISVYIDLAFKTQTFEICTCIQHNYSHKYFYTHVF